MNGYKQVGGWARHRPSITEQETSFCKNCGRPLTGAGRYREQCDRCYRAQMRQDANESEVSK